MATLTLSSLSLEYIRVAVDASEFGVKVDPTALPVYFAFMESGDPEATDWRLGEWENDGTTFWARILVGPGGEELPKGKYFVWVRVTDNPEIPVRNTGRVVLI